MKSVLKVVIPLVLVILVMIVCCFIFVPAVPKFKESSEFKYIEKNKKNIDEVIVRTVTLLGESCYQIDIDRGIEIINGISLKKKTHMTCTDSDMYLEFYFKNDEYRKLYFECGNLIYKNSKYKLKNEIILYNKDVFVPEKIIGSMIIVSEENKTLCK